MRSIPVYSSSDGGEGKRHGRIFKQVISSSEANGSSGCIHLSELPYFVLGTSLHLWEMFPSIGNVSVIGRFRYVLAKGKCDRSFLG